MNVQKHLLLIVFTTFPMFGRIGAKAPEFTCMDGTVITANKLCDGVQDCDGSDEILSNVSTPNGQIYKASCFLASTRRRCLVHRDYVCNGTIGCVNLTLCDVGCPSHYRCQNGACVKRSTTCDGNGCYGCSEDDGWSTGTGFKCVVNGSVCRLPQQLLWDNVQDCDDGSDLCYGTNHAISDGRDIRRILTDASFNQQLCFVCMDGSMIVPRKKVCDGLIDCSDLSDECLCSRQVASVCDSVIYHNLLAGNVSSQTLCKQGQILCSNSSQCINRSMVCDGTVNCPWHDDEWYDYCQETLPCRNGLPKEGGVICRCDGDCRRGYGTLCDGIGDCPVPSKYGRWDVPPGFPADECWTSCQIAPQFQCTKHSYGIIGPALGSWGPKRCMCFNSLSNGTRIPKPCGVPFEEFCDGIVQCTADMKDERNCPSRFRCPSGEKISIPIQKVCDGILDCRNMWDENKTACPNRFHCSSLRGKLVSIPKNLVCDFNINCDNKEDERNCTMDGRFYCENENPLFVTRILKVLQCIEKTFSDRVSASVNQASKKLFIKIGLTCLRDISEIQWVFNGRGDCTDWSDECPSQGANKKVNVLSSRYELIGNPFLRALVWIMGISAVIGNMVSVSGFLTTAISMQAEGVINLLVVVSLMLLRHGAGAFHNFASAFLSSQVVIIGESKQLHAIFQKDEAASVYTNHMLVLNLAMSDFLMGVYLIMLGIAGIVYSGVYCSKTLEWLSSQSCVVMGVLVVLSSQTSMLTMMLLTIGRLYAVYRPFLSLNKPKKSTVILSIILTWTISSIIALLPLASTQQDVFVENVWVQRHVFFDEVVHFDEAKKYTKRMLTYSPALENLSDSAAQQVMNFKSWWELSSFFEAHALGSDSFKIYRYFGYYSANSVCIPNFFATRANWSWKFSLSLTIFNFLSFLFIAAAYIMIIWKVTRRVGVKNSQNTKKNAGTQRKIMRLVATDFCCWIPLCIMVFINFSGVNIGSIGYAITAIVLLPINSALNPILYSNFIDNIWDKLRPKSSEKQSSMATRSSTTTKT